MCPPAGKLQTSAVCVFDNHACHFFLFGRNRQRKTTKSEKNVVRRKNGLFAAKNAENIVYICTVETAAAASAIVG
jgi:hypothetical protein